MLYIDRTWTQLKVSIEKRSPCTGMHVYKLGQDYLGMPGVCPTIKRTENMLIYKKGTDLQGNRSEAEFAVAVLRIETGEKEFHGILPNSPIFPPVSVVLLFYRSCNIEDEI